MDGNTNQGRPLVSCFVSCFCTAKRGKGCEIGIFLIVEKDCFQNYCTMHHQDLFFEWFFPQTHSSRKNFRSCKVLIFQTNCTRQYSDLQSIWDFSTEMLSQYRRFTVSWVSGKVAWVTFWISFRIFLWISHWC